ncbi:hypothetical protein GPA10_23875 [Streptomyces sp. p1417]|uniref:Polyketide cyclase / dehydrase and lipid transport n=1 Tax=Streptomyces typhae TaxID=2681492 RepID=A0A6L6X1M9_9ACTN|nr:hypothetical protein [Streptomyces typhae]MVO87713.1 hypothetical protein [Streptomyces typhae]
MQHRLKPVGLEFIAAAPGLRALVEEWRLAPVTATRTRVQWTFAAGAAAPLRLALRHGRRGLDRSFTTAVTNLDRLLAGKDAS